MQCYERFLLEAVRERCSFCAIEEGTGRIVGTVIGSVKYRWDLETKTTVEESCKVDYCYCALLAGYEAPTI